MKYEKKVITALEQVNKLKNRGLLIKDIDLSSKYLHNISYYRLRAYTYPFQNNEDGSEHEFIRNDISFDDIIDIYCFDRRLRSLIFNAIEKIEISLRSKLALIYSVDKDDAFWFMNKNLYYTEEKFYEINSIIKKEVNRSREDFIKHYFDKYTEPILPPSWMTLETVSMGTLSKILKYLKKSDKSIKSIVKEYGLYKVDIFITWIHGLATLRNICAHHGRLWNRRFVVTLNYPNNTDYDFMGQEEYSKIRDNKLFAYLSIILYLLNVISPSSSFRDNLISLIKERPKLIDLKDMGFPNDWKTFTLWNYKK